MSKKITTFRIATVFSALFILAHLVAAILLSRERLYLDAAYYFFHVVNEETFRIEHQRIILALSQCLLLPGVKMHLPIPVLLALYSITPVLFSASLIFISLYFFKSETCALLIILCNVCGSYFLFYTPMYEVCYSMVLLSFLWMLAEKGFYQTNKQALIYLLLLTVSLLGYPLTIYGCILLLLYYWFSKGKFPVRLAFIYSIVIIFWMGIKYFLISDYEKAKVTVAPGEYSGILHTIFSFRFAGDAIVYLVQHYPEALIAAIVFSLIEVKQKKYWQAAIPLLAIVSYMLIVNFGYRGNGLRFNENFERMYLVLIPVCFAPLLLMAYPSFSANMKIVCVVLVIGLCSYRFVTIVRHSSFYSHRLQLIDSMTTDALHHGCDKAAVDWVRVSPDLDQWSTGMEGLVYSSAAGKSSMLSEYQTIIWFNDHKELDNQHFILVMSEIRDRDWLNPKYFSLDSSAYCMFPPH